MIPSGALLLHRLAPRRPSAAAVAKAEERERESARHAEEITRLREVHAALIARQRPPSDGGNAELVR